MYKDVLCLTNWENNIGMEAKRKRKILSNTPKREEIIALKGGVEKGSFG